MTDPVSASCATRRPQRTSSRPRLGAAVGLLLVAMLAACQRQPRAREREAAEAEAKARAQAREAARLASLPLPEEPPVEVLRVQNSGLPCAVDDVFARKCRRCHTVPTRHGAPLVFLTWEDTRQDRQGLSIASIIGRAVRTGFMPYRMEANPPVLPLTDDEKKVILDWVDAGAPRGDCGASPKASASSAPLTSATRLRHAAPAPSAARLRSP